MRRLQTSSAIHATLLLALVLFAVPTTAVAVSAAADREVPIQAWTAPPFWSPAAAQTDDNASWTNTSTSDSTRETLGRASLIVATPPVLPLTTITPCRIVDTRGNGQTGAFGTPQLAANTSRTIPVPTHPTCTGIPSNAGAYSLNLTVTNTGTGAYGYLQAWPTGQPQPNTSNLNYPGPGATLANAAVVPAGTSGSFDIFSGNASADVIIDINGYYAPLNTPYFGGSEGYAALTSGAGFGYNAVGVNIGNSTKCMVTALGGITGGITVLRQLVYPAWRVNGTTTDNFYNNWCFMNTPASASSWWQCSVTGIFTPTGSATNTYDFGCGFTQGSYSGTAATGAICHATVICFP